MPSTVRLCFAVKSFVKPAAIAVSLFATIETVCLLVVVMLHRSFLLPGRGPVIGRGLLAPRCHGQATKHPACHAQVGETVRGRFGPHWPESSQHWPNPATENRSQRFLTAFRPGTHRPETGQLGKAACTATDPHRTTTDPPGTKTDPHRTTNGSSWDEDRSSSHDDPILLGRRPIPVARRLILLGRRPIPVARRPIRLGRRLIPVARRSIPGGRAAILDGRPPVRGGRAVMQGGRPVVRRGSASILEGSVAVRRGSAPVREGSAFVRRGSPPVQGGSVVVRRGSVSVRLGRAVVLGGSTPVRRGSPPVRLA